MESKDIGEGFLSGPSLSTGPVELGMEANAWDTYDTVFLNAKAGMDSVDKKKVQKVVYDMSKGSRYFNNEQRKEAEVLQRIQRMNARMACLTSAELAEHEKATDVKIAELEASRDLSHIWVHVDMDAFYAAVETLVNPSLAGKPMAVGGMSMICTANYEARKFGVRAAMPGFIARKLCPDLIFARPDFKKYSYYSDLSRQVFKEYDPDFVSRSMDEAYLDISKPCQLRNMSGAEVAEELRKKVHSATGLTCSAGIGPNRLLAKICSDINKPNGQFELGHERGAIMTFISSLPIRKVNGIGKVTERLLREVLGISTCADLVTKRSYISALFSQISTEFFLAVGLGIGGSETPQKEPRKSLSNERTFAAITDEHQLFKKLEELVDLLVIDMEKESLQGRTLTLKLKETGFEVRTRAITVASFISTKAEIWEHAAKLLRAELPLSLRLMGLRMSSFKGETSDPSQRTLANFITKSGAARSDQTTPVSNRLHNVPDSLSDDEKSMPAEVKDNQHDPGLGSSVQEDGAGRERPLGSEMLQTVMPKHALPNITPQKSSIQSQRTLDNPKTPPNSKTNSKVKSPGSLQTKLEDLIPSPMKRTSRTEDKSNHCTDMSEDSKATKRIYSVEDVLEEDTCVPPEHCDQTTTSSFHQEAEQMRELAAAVDTTEPSWETLQSGYDSVHEQVWKDNQCGLCGTEVNDCLPSARQEHEDFHFAVWLQQQGEETGVLQRSTTTQTTKKATRGIEGRESNKRKLSGEKAKQPHKRGSSLSIEAFFSKAK